jgi:HAD superfamily hydrolase (TIGR01549 family)
VTLPVSAIIWDFDGTLVDTRQRNYNVVRRLLADVTAKSPDGIPALRSAEFYDGVTRRYANWRQLYVEEFGFSEEETDRIGRLWSQSQLSDDTPVAVFAGIRETLAQLTAVRHGVVSQNAEAQIRRTLEGAEIAHHFRHVIGYDGVHIKRQKPEPDGLLVCLEALTGFRPARALYVGDHETDIKCAQNAQRAMRNRSLDIEIRSVAATFIDNGAPHEWRTQPDFVARHPRDLISIARGLQPEA